LNKTKEVAMLLKMILTEFTEPVCPIPVFENFLYPKINELMSSDASQEKKMDFVIELLVKKIGLRNEDDERTVNVDTLLFLAEVFKIVGENSVSTGITMDADGIGKLTSRNIFKPA
jgi:hypothetical protein